MAGNVVYAASQWLTLVVMAKFGTPEMVGQFALALAIVMPILTFASLQLRVLQATDATGRFEFGHYLAVRLLTALVGLLLVSGAVFVGNYPPATVLVIAAVAVARSLDALSEVYYGLLQQRERMDYIAISLILHGLLQLLAFGLVISSSMSVVAAVGAMAAVSLAVLMLYDVPAARRLSGGMEGASGAVSVPVHRRHAPKWDVEAVRKIALLGLPISIVLTLNSLTGNIPRYFIAESLGERALGIFAAMFYLTVAGSTVMGAVGNAASPRLAKLIAVGDVPAFQRLLKKLTGIAVVTGLAGFAVAYLAGGPLLALVYRPEYAEHLGSFLWMMAATGPMYVASVLGVGINAMRRFHVQVPMPVLNVVATFAVAAAFIPKHGLLGAGQVVFLSSCASMVGTYVVLVFCLRAKAAG